MANKKQSKSASSYVQRLFEDEYIQGQLRDAASGIRSAYGRVRKRPAEAAEDKKVYGSVRQAAISIRKALVALRRPEPEPEPKHRFRGLLIALAVVGASVWVISKRGSTPAPAGPSTTDAAGVIPSDGAPEPSAQPHTTSG